MNYLIALLCLSLACFANASSSTAATNSTALELNYSLIAERSHKPTLFTQGLLLSGEHFYESSGRYDKSLLVSYPLREPEGTWAKISAPFSQKKSLADKYFAEGLTLHNNKLYLLTWREKTLLVFDTPSLQQVSSISYSGEGWGLTSNGRQLIRSDGSDRLFFHNAETFAVEKALHVQLHNNPVGNLNELEYSEEFIWANVWQDNRIVKISPDTGEVVGILDLSALAQSLGLSDPESVLNGIAYDKERKAFWVTGKLWPKMFLIKIL